MDAFELMAKLGLDSSEYESGLKDAENKGSSFGKGLGKAAKVGAAAITAATGATMTFAGTAVKAGADFDASMAQVAATMGTTVDEIGNLRDFAQQMGSTTAFSATQSADALNYMALAGYTADESMAMLPNVLNLAAAGSIDLARASDMVTDAQSALGLTAEETTTMVDQMAKTSSKSNTSVEQLGDAILTIGATARGVKGGTQELSTVLGILADNGIKGSEGGTHLRNAILSLQTPTKKGIMALEQLGMTYEDMYDEAGNMRALPEIFQQLSSAMEGMTQQSKDAIISGIFNKTDLASINALLGTTTERWNELAGDIEKSDDAAQNMAKTQLDNLAGDVTLFKSALEGAQIAISDVLTPSLREFVQFGTDGLSKLTIAFQEGGLSGAMGALGGILSDGLSMIIKKLPEFVEGGMKLLGALGQGLLDNLPMIVDTAVKVASEVLNGLVSAIPSIVQGLASALPQLLTGLVDLLTDVFGRLAEILPELIPTVVTAIIDSLMSLLENADSLIEVAITFVTSLIQGIINALPILIERLPEVVTAIVDAIVDSLPLIIDAAIQLIGALIEAILANLGPLVAAGIKIIVALIDGILNALPDLLALIPKLIIEIVTSILKSLPEIVGGGVKIIGALIEGIVSMIGSVIETIIGLVNAIIDVIGSLLSSLFEVGVDIITNIKDGIASIGKNAAQWGRDLIDNFVGGIKDKIGSVKDTVAGIASTIKGYLGFSEPEEGPLSNFHTFAPDMIDLFTKGIKDNSSQLTSAVDDLASDVYDAMPQFQLSGGYGIMDSGSSASASGDYGDIVTAITDALMNMQLMVNIGNKPIEAMITGAQQRTNFKSGGR